MKSAIKESLKRASARKTGEVWGERKVATRLSERATRYRIEIKNIQRSPTLSGRGFLFLLFLVE